MLASAALIIATPSYHLTGANRPILHLQSNYCCLLLLGRPDHLVGDFGASQKLWSIETLRALNGRTMDHFDARKNSRQAWSHRPVVKPP